MAAVLTLLVAAVFQPASGDDGRAAAETRLETYIDELFESEPAWGSALVARDGRVLFKKSYGWADYEAGRENAGQTIFRIQSLSKTFTAVATLMLVERGRLSLDDRVLDYVPELVEGDGITIRHLLRMESGIHDPISDPEVQANLDRYHLPEELLDYFAGHPLRFEPGTRYEYSNSNYILLGLIIERVTGRSYRHFLNRNIFKPVVMRRSRYDPADLAFPRTRAVGYDEIRVDPPVVARHIHPSLGYAAGGIMSTTRDLLKYDQALYTDLLLSEETREEAFTPGISAYGLGWIIHNVRIRGDRHKLVWHSGGGPGFRSVLVRMVDARVTLVLLFNTTGVEEIEDDEVFRRVKRIAKRVGKIVLRDSR